MKTTLATLVLSTAGTLLATPAFAQGVDEFGPYGYDAETLESPQSGALELRFGPYKPRIDEEFAGSSGPYEQHFHNDRRWMIGFEYDWQLLKIPSFGTLGPGVGFGFTKMQGDVYTEVGAKTDGTSTLRILPMHFTAVLRADVIAKKTPVPLVPYLKGGIGYAMWWVDGVRHIEEAPDGSKASDTSWGTQWAVGCMLLLDVFDPREAANIDATSGVNNSYVFFEWFQTDLDGFGSGDHMQVGTKSWVTGIAMEM